MPITKTKIKRMEEAIANRETKYHFSGIQLEGKPWSIVEINNGKDVKRVFSNSEEGRNLIENKQVKYPKVPIIILDND